MSNVVGQEQTTDRFHDDFTNGGEERKVSSDWSRINIPDNHQVESNGNVMVPLLFDCLSIQTKH